MSRAALLACLAAIAAAGCTGDDDSAAPSPPPADGTRPCPARHAFELPPPPDESGDGLPASGTATVAAAEAVVDDLRARWRGRPAVVDQVDGRAWVAEGEIVAERLAVVRVTLGAVAECPDAPVFFNGVPVVFVVEQPAG